MAGIEHVRLRLGPLGVEGARVLPGARPHVGDRVDPGVGVGLLTEQNYVTARRCGRCFTSSGIWRFMKASNIGTVNSVSP